MTSAKLTPLAALSKLAKGPFVTPTTPAFFAQRTDTQGTVITTLGIVRAISPWVAASAIARLLDEPAVVYSGLFEEADLPEAIVHDEGGTAFRALGPRVRYAEHRLLLRAAVPVGVEMVDQPSHYHSHASKIPAIDAIEWLSGNLFTALKYLFRHEHKGASVTDRQKSQWYLRRECQRIQSLLFSEATWLKALEIEMPILRKVQRADPDTLLGQAIEALLEHGPIETRLTDMIALIDASFIRGGP